MDLLGRASRGESPLLQKGASLAAEFKAQGQREEASTLEMFCREESIQIAEGYLSLPISQQKTAITAGLEACSFCAEAAVQLGDLPCAAHYLTRLGNGLYTTRDFRRAERTFEEALKIVRRLAAERPHDYKPEVARNLIHLANVLESQREIEKAIEAFREAIRLLRELDHQQSDLYRLDLAMALNDLGYLQNAAESRDEAVTSYKESLSLLTDVPGVRGRVPVILVRSKVLYNLLHSQWDLDQCILQADEETIRLAVAAAYRLREELWRFPGATPQEMSIRVQGLTNLGYVLGWLGKKGEAQKVLREAEEGAQRLAPSLHRAEVFLACATVEQVGAADPFMAGGDWCERAVEAMEHAVARLDSAERSDVSAFKADFEVAYSKCLRRSAEEGDAARVFQLLESLRNVDKLSGGTPSDHSRSGHEADLTAAKAWVAQHDIIYLAIQVVPKGAVFLALLPAGKVVMTSIAIGWTGKFFDLFHKLNDLIRTAARDVLVHGGAGRDCAGFDQHRSYLEHTGHELFHLLPDEVKEIFTRATGNVFVSSYADLHNLPFELLCPHPGEWIGLRQLLPRVHSFRELQTILPRRPDTRGRSAMVVGDPGGDLSHARRAAEDLAKILKERNFALRPRGQPLLRQMATVERFLEGLNSRVSLAVYCGHGGYDRFGPFLSLAGSERLRPPDIQRISFDLNPIVYYDCCEAGIADYEPGGRHIGFGAFSIAAGASCCLQANRRIFDDLAAGMFKTFFDGLLLEGQTAGAALFCARRKMADLHPSPLAWAFPVLVGNPNATFSF